MLELIEPRSGGKILVDALLHNAVDTVYCVPGESYLPVRVACAAPDPAAMIELRELLRAARKPLVVLGGTGWDAEASQAIKHFVTVNNLPVAASFRRQDLFDNRDPHYVGQLGLGISPKLAERLCTTDLLLVIGSRLSETVSNGYTLIKSPVPTQPLVHVHPDPREH